MKKIILVVAALVSASATFAQSNTAALKSDAKANTQAAASKKNKQVSADAETNTTATVSGDELAKAEKKAQKRADKTKRNAKEAKTKAENHGQTVSEAAHNTSGSVKATATAKGEAAKESAATNVDVATETTVNTTTTATTDVKGKVAKPAKDKAAAAKDQDVPQERKDNHGKLVSEASHAFDAEATTSNKGQVISEIASVNGQADAEGKVKGSARRPERGQGNGSQTKEERKDGKKTKETSGEVVTEATQNTTTKVDAQGQEVKEVATARRKGKPTRVNGEVGSETSGRAAGAVRAVPAGRPQGAGRPSAARPSRVVNVGGGASKPVKVDAGVKAGTSIRVGR